jgi:tryptophanyl-tRNA synthetase
MTSQNEKKIMLSALTPSNRITIGNYLGAIRNWVNLSRDYECLFFAVDLHALTERRDPKLQRELSRKAIAFYLACGLDPDANTIFYQSHVKEHAELAWILTCHSSMGELSRMTQYKDKSSKHGESIPTGLFCYPVLMAADILLYQTNLVPVGIDQKQHIELARDLALRMNNLYSPGWDKLGKDGSPAKVKPLFTVPEPVIPTLGAKIMSLQDPTKKMSKSDPDALASVFLDDSDKDIEKKVKRAVTDSGSEIKNTPDKPGVQNLLTIQSVLTGKSFTELEESYLGKQYGHLKVDTAEILIETIRPIREKAEAYLKDEAFLQECLKKGADKARKRAEATMTRVRDELGLISI